MVWWKNKTRARILFENASNGRLTDEERGEIIQRLNEYLIEDIDEQEHELSYLLDAMGSDWACSGHNPDCQKLVEKFLYYPKHPFRTSEALSVLCSEWNLASVYINYIKLFMTGVDWDYADNIRICALSIAGDCYRINHDIECLGYLISLVDNQNEDNSTRDWAFNCISSALGVKWKKEMGFDEMGSSPHIIPDYVDHPTIMQILNQARQIVMDSKKTRKE